MTDTIDLPPSEKPVQIAVRDKAAPSGEAEKAKLIRKAAALAEEHLEAAERGQAARVIAKLYEHVPPGDVAARSPRDLGGAALSLWRFAERRRAGHAKIRVYNPETDIDGWASPHTVVEIVNDDMPFLVDSVTTAINAHDRVVDLVIHPIVGVDRDAGGRLGDIAESESDGAGLRESWMQIEITRDRDPAGLAALTQALSGVLADVRS